MNFSGSDGWEGEHIPHERSRMIKMNSKGQESEQSKGFIEAFTPRGVFQCDNTSSFFNRPVIPNCGILVSLFLHLNQTD